MSAGLPTRSPADVGYVPWVVHRLAAVLLVPLLGLHVGVQVYPQYGFAAVYDWGVYGGLLDFTLGLVLLHGVLGVRATVIESSLSRRATTAAVWGVGLAALVVLLVRLFG